MEPWIQNVLEHYLLGEFTTISKKDGTPITLPMLFFYVDNEIILTSSVIFCKKCENIRHNPNVSLLLSDNTGSGLEENPVILLQGKAYIDDSDLDHGWEKYKEAWLRKEPMIKAHFDLRDTLPTFWKRVIIRFHPEKIIAWKDGDTTKEPQIMAWT